MSEKFIQLINHYDLLIDQMKHLEDEALEFESPDQMEATCQFAALIRCKIGAALITLKIP